jgi:hypothetical protein
MPNGSEFEMDVANGLDHLCPHSRLSRVLLFRPDLPEHRRYGFEIDHLIHIRDGLVDRLLIIECKNQEVRVQGQAWNVTYNGESHDTISQLWNQSVSLLRHLSDQDSGRQLSIVACVVSSYPTPVVQAKRGPDDRVSFHLFNKARFFEWLKRLTAHVQRVEQSRILTELRQGVALPELGRPDIANAIAFVKDCRRSLDLELFRRFPTSMGMSWRSQAAINGTAGMGKSVMLAYVLFVLSCDYCVEADDTSGARRLVHLGQRSDDLCLPKHALRSIVAFGMSQKQVGVLQSLWRHFVRVFGSLENGHLLHFHQPTFKQWDAIIPDECNVLIVDEAHDLPIEAQRIIARWKGEEDDEGDQRRYLLVACDRHQRLRLAGHGANIIDGLGGGGFASHTLRLRRNYRSPFPVYAASLALMFRWFAESGPKVIPARDELEGSFGFKVEQRMGQEPWVMSVINDSHPGNHWCYTVSRFLSPQDALRQVRFLRREDVLWVRFCSEDDFFDYEQLAAFTYHPMEGGGSPALIDKYIKGQEFNVVVIEGMPANAMINLQSTASTADPDEAECRMWQARRELYLCASRANVFLFFVLKPDAEGEGELEHLLSQVRTPSNVESRLWEIRFADGQPTRRPSAIDHFNDSTATEIVQATGSSIVTLRPTLPLTFGSLVAALQAAKGLDLQTSMRQTVEAISSLGLSGIRTDSMLPVDRIGEIEDRLGVLISVDTNPVASPNSMGENEPQRKPPVSPKLKSGIRVSDAASLLGVSSQRLLDLLPVNYQASTVLTDSDIPRLASYATRPSNNLGPTTTANKSEASPHQWSSTLAEQLARRMEQADYVRQRKMVRKYVMFLSEFVKLSPEGEAHLLAYRPRHRAYFARTEDEIMRDQPYASVYRLANNGLYAMCTLSNESKITVLRKVLGDNGVPPQDVRVLLSML